MGLMGHVCMWRGLVVWGDHACMGLKMEGDEHRCNEWKEMGLSDGKKTQVMG